MQRIATSTLILGAIVSLLVACVAWYLVATLTVVPAEPVEVNAYHEFGNVRIDEGEVELDHVFALHNVSDRTLRVANVRSSCGCTVADVPVREVHPGEAIDVRASLAVRRPGRYSENIWINLEDVGTLTLTVAATGRRMEDLYANYSTVPLTQTGNERILLVLTEAGHATEPPAPHLRVPDGVAARFAGWRIVLEPDEEISRPARWHGIVELECDAGSIDLPPGARLIVELPQLGTAEVELTGRVWALRNPPPRLADDAR